VPKIQRSKVSGRVLTTKAGDVELAIPKQRDDELATLGELELAK
jgi:hypothetical protein